MVGTVLYFAIVYSLPISMGLAAVALDLPLSHCPCPCHTESFVLCSDWLWTLSVDGGSNSCAQQGKFHLIRMSNAMLVDVPSSLAIPPHRPGVT